MTDRAEDPGWRELWRTFGRIGLLSFGGPAAQIALMHRELVDRRAWLGEGEYLRALSFCMLLPGPEAMQLATYAGWKLRGVPGGLLAGLLFIGPGAAVILALAALYLNFGQLPLVSAAFLGIKACVVVIVFEALVRVSRRALTGARPTAIAAGALAAIFLFGVPFPAIIAAAAITGALLLPAGAPAVPALPRRAGPPLLPVLAVGLALWAAPLVLAHLAGAAFLTEIGLFFSKLAVVTFGGAYAVLAYMAQEIVTQRGWLTAAELMDALGLAETTPGPLILVTEFAGLLAGHARGGWPLALAAGGMTLWVTFLPSFLWIFALAPQVERIAGRPRLAAALAGVTAAVVGVIANLGLWFALHLFFGAPGQVSVGPLRLPDLSGTAFDIRAGLIALVCGVALVGLHWRMPVVLALSAALGIVSGIA